MRFAVLVMALLASTARADSKQPFGLTLGADGHASASSEVILTDISPRLEVKPTPHHALVLRGGVGRASLFEVESGMPDYDSHRFVAAGYRFQLDHAYFGAEAGREWLRPHGGDEPMQGYTWSVKNVVMLVVGAKLGPVDVGVDVEPRGRIGVHVGVDLVRFSL